MLTEKTFDTGEIVINFAEGETAAAPLVLLHGATLRWQSFEGLIPTLERSWHVYACDLRGHGESGWANSGYRFIDYVPDAITFIERHISRPTVLLGFSVGAAVTLGVAARLPKLIRGIVLLDPPLLLRDASIKEAIGSNGTGPYLWLTWLMETLTTTNTFEEIIARCKEYWSDADEVEIRDTASNWLTKIDPALIACILNDQFFDGFDWEKILARVTCPALLIHGERELASLVRNRDVVYLASHIPQLVSKQIQGVGHGVIWDEPGEETLAHVTEFLDSL